MNASEPRATTHHSLLLTLHSSPLRIGPGKNVKFLLDIILPALTLLWLVCGCLAPPNREINVAYFYPSQNQTELQITYRVPPPPDGKVYVLWVLNPGQGTVVKIGQLPPSPELKLVKTSVDFYAVGVIVSIEDSPDVPGPSNTWALTAGVIDPKTPTPP